MNLFLQILIVQTVLLCGVMNGSDYVRSSLSAGGYLADSKDDTSGRKIYHQETINLTARQGALGYFVSARNSDFHRLRSQSYQNLFRVSLAEVRYVNKNESMQLFLGRKFIPLVERSIILDGAGIGLSLSNALSLELLGGLSLPSPYDKILISTESDHLSFAFRSEYMPVPGLSLLLDGSKSGSADKGSAGARMRWALPGELYALTEIVGDFNKKSLSNANTGISFSPRETDIIQLFAGLQREQPESTAYYEVLFRDDHFYASLAYTGMPIKKVQLIASYGTLIYNDAAGHMLEIRLALGNYYASYSFHRESVIVSNEIRTGYSFSGFRPLYVTSALGYVRYQLSDRISRAAFDAALGIQFPILKNISGDVSYELMHNRSYAFDNRAYVGVKYNFVRKIGKK